MPNPQTIQTMLVCPIPAERGETLQEAPPPPSNIGNGTVKSFVRKEVSNPHPLGDRKVRSQGGKGGQMGERQAKG